MNIFSSSFMYHLKFFIHNKKWGYSRSFKRFLKILSNCFFEWKKLPRIFFKLFFKIIFISLEVHIKNFNLNLPNRFHIFNFLNFFLFYLLFFIFINFLKLFGFRIKFLLFLIVILIIILILLFRRPLLLWFWDFINFVVKFLKLLRKI